MRRHLASQGLHRIGAWRNTKMARLAFYVGGISAAVAACVVFWDKRRAKRPVPVNKAAAMLQRAWADHHTRA
jgi:hypothetical protein